MWATRAFILLIATTFGTLLVSGEWRRCVLSTAWCAGDELPYEIFRRVFVAVVGLFGIVCNLFILFNTVGKSKSANTFVQLSCVTSFCVGLCLVTPMSCGALKETHWEYLSWTDPLHDAALLGAIVSFILSLVARPPLCGSFPRTVPVFIVSVVPMLALVNWCPILALWARACVLVLEVIALVSMQLSFVSICGAYA
jgi:hypothetical protein